MTEYKELKPQQLIQHTKHWVKTVVIEQHFCPFAKREFDKNRIHYAVITESDLVSQIEQLHTQCRLLDDDPSIATSLLIYPHGVDDFEDYLDLLTLGTEILEKLGYEGTYQLASFHPNYCFANTAPEDASNYTNRSPYPMLHILRESQLATAVEAHPHPEKIPEDNIKTCHQLGHATLQKLLNDCYQQNTK